MFGNDFAKVRIICLFRSTHRSFRVYPATCRVSLHRCFVYGSDIVSFLETVKTLLEKEVCYMFLDLYILSFASLIS